MPDRVPDGKDVSTLRRQALAVLVLLTAAAALAFATLALPWSVSGPSMSPTLRAGDRVLVDLWTYRQRPPAPGEIALIEGPDGVPMVKRVAGPARSGGGLRVLGDNPSQSRDSRHFGPVARESFRGRVALRYWPPSRFGRIGPPRTR